MRVVVLIANGEEDEWDAVLPEMLPELGGALLIKDAENKLVAMYAPNMWIKFEVDVEDED